VTASRRLARLSVQATIINKANFEAHTCTCWTLCVHRAEICIRLSLQTSPDLQLPLLRPFSYHKIIKVQRHPLAAVMSDAYERERQNNSRLDELSSKVSALRHVTVDIYDNARSQEIIDSSNEVFSNLSTSIKGSAGRLGRMAQAGNKVAILKLAGMIVGIVVLLWWILSFFW